MTIKLSQAAYNAINDTIPEHMQDGLINYFERGIPPGDFLRAVLENDLVAAVAHADEINKKHLPEYVQFLYWHVPGRPHGGWGSPEAVQKWLSEAYEDNQAIA